jgi:hypothetical protein
VSNQRTGARERGELVELLGRPRHLDPEAEHAFYFDAEPAGRKDQADRRTHRVPDDMNRLAGREERCDVGGVLAVAVLGRVRGASMAAEVGHDDPPREARAQPLDERTPDRAVRAQAVQQDERGRSRAVLFNVKTHGGQGR